MKRLTYPEVLPDAAIDLPRRRFSRALIQAAATAAATLSFLTEFANALQSDASTTDGLP